MCISTCVYIYICVYTYVTICVYTYVHRYIKIYKQAGLRSSSGMVRQATGLLLAHGALKPGGQGTMAWDAKDH